MAKSVPLLDVQDVRLKIEFIKLNHNNKEAALRRLRSLFVNKAKVLEEKSHWLVIFRQPINKNAVLKPLQIEKGAKTLATGSRQHTNVGSETRKSRNVWTLYDLSNELFVQDIINLGDTRKPKTTVKIQTEQTFCPPFLKGDKTVNIRHELKKDSSVRVTTVGPRLLKKESSVPGRRDSQTFLVNMMNEEENDNPAIHPRHHAQATDSSDSGNSLMERITAMNLTSPSYTRAAIATSLSSFTEQGTRRHNQTVREPVIQLPDTSNARYQDFVNSDARKRTFRHSPGSTIWPHGGSIQDTDRLAEQGFFYTGRLDLCRCYFCGLGLKDWSSDDDMIFVHLRYSPNCEHITRTVDPNILSVYRRRISEIQVAGGITPNIPESGSPTTIRHPEFESYPVRLASFQAWPGDLMQTPEMLAEAGFFHTGLRDVVRCYACDGGLQRWDAGDQPWVEHARWFPECPHVIRVKGEEYIRLIQAATDNDEDEEDLEANAEVPVDSVYPLYSDAARTVMELGFSRMAVSIAIDECKAKNIPLNADNMMNILLDKQDKGEELPTDDPRPSSPKLPKFNEATKEGLLEEREYLRSRLICIQCDDRECNILFLPCGHLRMCTECSTNVEVCPLCSKAILQKIKTYMS